MFIIAGRVSGCGSGRMEMKWKMAVIKRMGVKWARYVLHTLLPLHGYTGAAFVLNTHSDMSDCVYIKLNIIPLVYTLSPK